jgi:hypothetical protein
VVCFVWGIGFVWCVSDRDTYTPDKTYTLVFFARELPALNVEMRVANAGMYGWFCRFLGGCRLLEQVLKPLHPTRMVIFRDQGGFYM